MVANGPVGGRAGGHRAVTRSRVDSGGWSAGVGGSRPGVEETL